MRNNPAFYFACVLPFLLTACDNASDDSDNKGDTQSASRAGFPSGMIVASPTSSGSSTSGKALTLNSVMNRTTGYDSLTSQLEDLLSGASSVSEVFDPEAFYAMSGDAECYGPELQYQDHPDAPDTNDDGSLPTGDLGIWEETLDTGEACAAAQLNAQLEGVQNRTFMSMMGLASLIIAYESDGHAWPDDVETSGSTGDLAATLNAEGIANVNFVSAEIEYDSATEQYSYSLELTYTRDSTDYDIAVSLIYDEVDGDENTYESLLNLLVEDTFVNGGDRCVNDNAVTRGTSLHFISNSATDIRLQAREAAWCEHFDFDLASDANGLTQDIATAGLSTEITGYVLNPDTDPDNNNATLDGWENNFAYFTADFNPDTLRGDYAYVWQAGPGDDKSRVFNVGLEVSDGSSGEAYFGYGDHVETTGFEHIVKGFICNWAGPGNDHTLLAYAQRQHITRSDSSGLFEPSNSNGSSSNITYAPTTSCTHAGGDSFLYDRDLDGDLNDETSDTVNVGTGQTLAFDLMDAVQAGTDYGTIDLYIQNGRGYDLPDYPN